MKLFELAYLAGELFLPVLRIKVRQDLKQLVRGTHAHPVQVLDVGARKSPYTVGLPAQITLLDIPREGEVMGQLNLGFTRELLESVQRRRSNIVSIVIQDMTRSDLPSESFDGVVSVEVIEHVPDDHAFVAQIARVLKPGGWAYFTTPNGDYVKNEPPNHNPDHVRHYKRDELAALLKQYFDSVEITYGIKTGKFRYRGMKGYSLAEPFQTIQGMACNVINRIESRGLEDQPYRTANLFAVARKAFS